MDRQMGAGETAEFYLEQPELRQQDTEGHCVYVTDIQMQQGRGNT